MRSLWSTCCLGLAMLACIPLARADHGSGGGSALTGGQTALDRIEPPRTNVNFTFEFNSLDNDAGHTLLYQVSGEYAFLQQFSIGALIPVWTAENALLPNNTRLGDVGLLFKAQAWASESLGMKLLTGLNTFFPTGNDDISLGAGTYTLSPYVTFLKDWQRIGVFLNLGSAFEIGEAINPTFTYEAGVIGKVLGGKISLALILSFQGVTFIDGDTFTDGSTKGFLQPGVELGLGEHWTMAFLGRISLLDTLNLKSNIAFNDFATGLYSDIQGSFVFNLGYQF